jgi:hypothetical protein
MQLKTAQGIPGLSLPMGTGDACLRNSYQHSLPAHRPCRRIEFNQIVYAAAKWKKVNTKERKTLTAVCVNHPFKTYTTFEKNKRSFVMDAKTCAGNSRFAGYGECKVHHGNPIYMKMS